MYERVLGLLYNNYVRAEVEFMYQIDQLTSRVRSMENCKKMKEPFNQHLFGGLLVKSNFEQDMESLVIIFTRGLRAFFNVPLRLLNVVIE